MILIFGFWLDEFQILKKGRTNLFGFHHRISDRGMILVPLTVTRSRDGHMAVVICHGCSIGDIEMCHLDPNNSCSLQPET